MILRNYSSRQHFLCKLGVVFVSILLFNKVAGEAFENFHILKYLEELEIDDLNGNALEYQQRDETHSENYYPYKKLLKIVEQTKELLLLREEDRHILKFNAKYDDDYLAGNNNKHSHKNQKNLALIPSLTKNYKKSAKPVPHQRRVISKNGRRKPVKLRSCEFIVNTLKPHHLKSMSGKNHLIFNLGNDFVQEINVTTCIKEHIDAECGDTSITPEAYRDVCEQNYGIYKLFSIPEGEEIDITNQVVEDFKLPNGCNCKRRHE